VRQSFEGINAALACCSVGEMDHGTKEASGEWYTFTLICATGKANWSISRFLVVVKLTVVGSAMQKGSRHVCEVRLDTYNSGFTMQTSTESPVLRLKSKSSVCMRGPIRNSVHLLKALGSQNIANCAWPSRWSLEMVRRPESNLRIPPTLNGSWTVGLSCKLIVVEKRFCLERPDGPPPPCDCSELQHVYRPYRGRIKQSSTATAKQQVACPSCNIRVHFGNLWSIR
jgi:hypothetical protein